MPPRVLQGHSEDQGTAVLQNPGDALAPNRVINYFMISIIEMINDCVQVCVLC